MKRSVFYRNGKTFFLLALVAALAWPLISSGFESKTSRAKGVRVEVRPLQLLTGQPAKFELRLNTHSVELNQDLAAVSVLRDNEGRSYRPTKWEGSPAGGHHRSGTLIFPNLEGTPKSVALIVKKVAGVPERIFNWKMKP